MDVAFTVPIRSQVLALSIEYSRLMDVAEENVAIGLPFAALVKVPVMFVLPPCLATIDGLNVTVAWVCVG